MRVLCLATLLVASSLLPAQGVTWVVDQAGGPGSQFTQIAPAVTAAANGDIIVIRSGTYFGFATSKALTLLGEGDVVIVVGPGLPFPPGPPPVSISNLPAGTAFVAHNLRIEYWNFRNGLELRDNQGRVHLQDVSVNLIAVPQESGAAASITRCDAVTWNGGHLNGRPCVLANQSVLAFSSLRVEGSDSCGSARCASIGAEEGMLLSSCTVQLSRCEVTGGSGVGLFTPLARGRPAISANHSALTVSGDDTTTVAAGDSGYGVTTPVPAILTTGGRVDLDTAVPIMGSLGGAEVAGTATVTRRRIVSVVATGGGLGDSLDVEVVSPAGDVVNLVISLPIAPVAVPPGLVFLDPRLIVPLFVGSQSATGRLELGVPIPTIEALRGATVALQAANVYAATGLVEFSNPAVAVLHDV
ncbi:MAG: hypothetical protein AAF628_37820 [Planctomycetota bacterium]